MATIDSSIDGSMTVVIMDAQECKALDELFTNIADGSPPDEIPGILWEMWQAL